MLNKILKNKKNKIDNKIIWEKNIRNVAKIFKQKLQTLKINYIKTQKLKLIIRDAFLINKIFFDNKCQNKLRN